MRAEKERNETAVAVAEVSEEQLRNDRTAEERQHESRHAWNEESFSPLFGKHEAKQFRTHWLEIQSRFVDDPDVSVKEADELVADVIMNITNSFADKRSSLENQWRRGDKVSTEDLRVALKRYRSFLDRLLTVET
jgi:hypothetical protein